jgi:hypothetical protein
MFASHYATNRWQAPGTYYNAPGFDWAFNNHFYNYTQLPPMTPSFKATIRGTWASF